MNGNRRRRDPAAVLRRLGVEEVTQRLEVSPLLLATGAEGGATATKGCCTRYHCKIWPDCPRPDNPPAPHPR